MIAHRSELFRAGTKSKLRTSVLLGCALAMLHGFLASIYIDHPPLVDEMYHIVAAESWRTSGELRTLDGHYLRTPLFTKLVGLNASICGPSLECARGISVAALLLLVFLVTVFTGTLMSPMAGLVAGLLLAVNPAVIALSQYLRFYSIHALAFFLFAATVFILAAYWRRVSIGMALVLAGVSATMLYAAYYLQIMTLIGLVAVILGAGTILAPDLLHWLRRQSRWFALLLLSMVGAAAALGIYATDVAGTITAFRYGGPAWSAGHEHLYFDYYHRLRRWHPVLWPMMAILAALSIARWPRPSIYVLVVFSSIFIALSLAGIKAHRFLVHALPFLFIPMAAGIVTGIELIRGFLQQRLAYLFNLKKSHPFVTMVPTVIVIGTVMMGAFSDPVIRGVARMITTSDYVTMFGGYDRIADWPSASDKIRELMTDYPTVIPSAGLKAVYYLGDFSFELSVNAVPETDTGVEFGLDSRTGRQVISNFDSILKVVHECGPALVIVEDGVYWGQETIMALDELVSRLTPAANIWVWRINPQDLDTSGVDFVPLEAGSLTCRPVTVLGAR